MKRLYAASELAKMGLPGLPSTKAAIMAKAEREGWQYEEQTGRGGLRRAYHVPARYFVESGGAADQQQHESKLNEVAGQRVKRFISQEKMTDSEIVEQIALGVEKWIGNNDLPASPEKKAALVALLFSYFRDEGGVTAEKLEDMLKKVA